jgi:hypothetical protein
MGKFTETKYLGGILSGEVCHVSVDRLRGFETKDIRFSLRSQDERDFHNIGKVSLDQHK